MYSLENLFWKTSQSSQVQTLQPTIEHFHIKFQIKEVQNSKTFQNVIIQQKPLPIIKKIPPGKTKQVPKNHAVLGLHPHRQIEVL